MFDMFQAKQVPQRFNGVLACDLVVALAWFCRWEIYGRAKHWQTNV